MPKNLHLFNSEVLSYKLLHRRNRGCIEISLQKKFSTDVTTKLSQYFKFKLSIRQARTAITFFVITKWPILNRRNIENVVTFLSRLRSKQFIPEIRVNV